ncbi:MAG TPA: phage holin family protein [Thermoanaerobaculia bacterium]|jgi:putative membrane protein|nr:phage holin family protein [Thermoanaerobaculia bacterium]
MIRALLQIALNGVAVLAAAYLVPGITYTGSLPALLLVGLVIGLINLIVKPIVTVFSLPLIVLTLGLFYLLINGMMLYLAAWLLPHHLQVSGCGAAILGGLVIALVNWLVRAFTSE